MTQPGRSGNRGRRPVVVIHGGAGPGSPEPAHRQACRTGLLGALDRSRGALADGGDAIEAVVAAVAFMEDEADCFNAGRGSVLCADGTVEMSAALMRGADRQAGAVAVLRRARQPILAARAVLEHSPHVMLVDATADAHAVAHGLDQRDPGYFVTERQQRRLIAAGSDFVCGTVGAVCLDADGRLAAGTSTGGRRGQVPGRVGDTPVIGAGTWADDQVAVSCTGDGEAFVRTAAAHQLALRVRTGAPLPDAAASALHDARSLGGLGGVIALDDAGNATMPFTAAAMNRGIWRPGAAPAVWA